MREESIANTNTLDNVRVEKPKNSRNYSYLRVSTREQTIDRQMVALRALNVDIDERDIYIDQFSGTTFDRPYYQALKRSIRPGDTLYIHSLDRLGRNKQGIKDEWEWFISQEIDIVVIDTPLISTTNYRHMGSMGKFISDLILEILSWLAEEEVEMMHKRQRAGIESAMARGVKFGRPRVEIDESFVKSYERWKASRISAVQAMEECGMAKTTFYRKVKEYEESLGIREELDPEVLELINAIKSGRISREEAEVFLKHRGQINASEE